MENPLGELENLKRGEDDADLAEFVARLSDRLRAGEELDVEMLCKAHPDRAEWLRRTIETLKLFIGLEDQ
jgi:hypothetical protein